MRGCEHLVSSQVLQKTIDELRAITRIDLCVLSLEGQKVASTFSEEGFEPEYVREFVKSPADSQVLQAYHFFKIYDDQNVEYVLVTSGGSEDAYMIGKIAVCEIQNLIVAYKERLDKNNFIQNLLLDNLLLVDIYNRAKKLRIDTEARRVVFIVETKYEKDNSAMETIKSLYASKPKDYITAIDEKNIIIVKEIKEADTYEELDHVAKTLVDMLNVEAMSQVRVSYGNIIHEIKDVSRSYKEAKMALEVGKIFYADKIIVPYNNLGIGRLIYQLPIPLCQMFMKEVFGEQLPDTFDEETHGKNENAIRTVVLHPLAAAELHAQLQQRAFEEGRPLRGDDPIFLLENEHSLYNYWQFYQRSNGIDPPVSLYELRHTFVSMVEDTVSPAQLRRMVGHSRSMDTYGWYSHAVEGRADAAALAVSAALAEYFPKQK